MLSISIVCSMVHLLNVTTLQAQSFFPLKIGNIWITVDLPPETPPLYLRYEVIDTTRIENQKYFVVNLNGIHYFREDSLQNFYEYSNGKEQIIMNFQMDVGDSLKISRHPSSTGYTVCIEIKKVTTFIGTTGTQKTFELDWNSQIIDEEVTFILQEGVGIFFYKPSFHMSEALVAAVIDGIAYGDLTVVTVQNINDKNLNEYVLHQNYPNPFNPSTTITFSLLKSSRVNIKIFNILGEQISILVDELLSAGSYEYKWEAGDLPGGVYIYILHTRSYNEAKKMVLLP